MKEDTNKYIAIENILSNLYFSNQGFDILKHLQIETWTVFLIVQNKVASH